MKHIKVNVKESYDIFIGKGLLEKSGSLIRKALKDKGDFQDAIIISNPRVWRLHRQPLESSILKTGFHVKPIIIPDSEAAKSFKELDKLIKKIAAVSQAKKVFIIALGGGVVGDVAGFAASIYKRGIPIIQVPTTLLAQIDASIGGKTGVDLIQGKNLIGSFYQPSLIISDVSVLATLSKRQLKSGLSEMVKYAVIKDPELFALLEGHLKGILKLKSSLLIKAISRCAEIKAEVVSKDEKDSKGVRIILNFGHTIGHAIETASNYRLNHGEAVALGMKAATNISLRLKLCKQRDYQRITGLLKTAGLDLKLTGINRRKIMRALTYDKKFIGAKNRFVLPKSLGSVTIKENVNPLIIRKALEELY